jgi:excisionase family DNA binding protein
MTVQETATALQVSRMTVLRMLADGRLTNVAPHIPARKRQPIRVAKSQVDALRPRPRDTPSRPKTVPAGIRYPAHVIVPLIAAETPGEYTAD